MHLRRTGGEDRRLLEVGWGSGWGGIPLCVHKAEVLGSLMVWGAIIRLGSSRIRHVVFLPSRHAVLKVVEVKEKGEREGGGLSEALPWITTSNWGGEEDVHDLFLFGVAVGCASGCVSAARGLCGATGWGGR